jgi:hypothetical protein
LEEDEDRSRLLLLLLLLFFLSFLLAFDCFFSSCSFRPPRNFDRDLLFVPPLSSSAACSRVLSWERGGKAVAASGMAL